MIVLVIWTCFFLRCASMLGSSFSWCLLLLLVFVWFVDFLFSGLICWGGLIYMFSSFAIAALPVALDRWFLLRLLIKSVDLLGDLVILVARFGFLDFWLMVVFRLLLKTMDMSYVFNLMILVGQIGFPQFWLMILFSFFSYVVDLLGVRIYYWLLGLDFYRDTLTSIWLKTWLFEHS